MYWWDGGLFKRKFMALKSQDSFGEFNKKILDHQKVQEIIRKHHQTFLQLFWMTYCNAILPSSKLSLCTYPMAKCFFFGGGGGGGDSKHLYVLVISWKWKHFGANCFNSINSSYNSIKFCINKNKLSIFIFAMCQNYPLALMVTFTYVIKRKSIMLRQRHGSDIWTLLLIFFLLCCRWSSLVQVLRMTELVTRSHSTVEVILSWVVLLFLT